MWRNNGQYKISYELNGGSGGPSAPQTGTQIGGEITLNSTRPTNSNSNLYFTGWCNKQTSDNKCSGKVYWPGEAYPLSDGYTVTMYALWAPLELKNLGNLNTTMQEFNCNEKLPNVYNYGTVTDSRDNNTYSVARLKDGRCWMTQNLRIQNITINNETSDIMKDSFYIPSSKYGSGTFSSADSSSVYIDSNNSYGGFYNWFAATAGEGNSAMSSGDVSQSICPKGWGLPNKNAVDILVQYYDYISARQNPANFVNNGIIDVNGLFYWCGNISRNNCSSVGGDGYLYLVSAWNTSTAYDVTNRYHLLLHSGSSNYNTGNFYVNENWRSKPAGFHVRCISDI